MRKITLVTLEIEADLLVTYTIQGPYELCDAVRGSDHRPVSQAFFLKVNSAINAPDSIGDLIPMKLTLSDVRMHIQGYKSVQLF